MAIATLKYTLADGYLQNWLVAGPLLQPVTRSDAANPDRAWATVQRYFEPDSGVTEAPVDLGPLRPSTQDQPAPTWRYYRCLDDHFVDFTTAYPAWCYLRAWAFAQLNIPASQSVTLVLTTYGPADVWLNGQHLHRQAQLDPAHPHSVSIPCTLAPGTNELLLRFESAGVGAIPCVIALRVAGLTEGAAQVSLPTNIETDLVEKRQSLERLVSQATLDRYVFGYLDGDHNDRNEAISVSFPADAQGEETITFRLQSLAGDIFQERVSVCKAGTKIELAKSFPLRNGPHHVALSPEIREAYEKNLRFQRNDLFFVTRTPYAQIPNANNPLERQAALEDASRRRSNSLYSELAKMELAHWEQVNWKIVDQSMERVGRGYAGSETDLLGLLGALLRYRKPQRHLSGIRAQVESLAAGYEYTLSDAGPADSLESRQILSHTGEVLAGQLLPDRIFERSGQTGRWHQDHGVAAALAWLRLHGRHGFQSWDAPAEVESIVAALAHLVDLAASEPLRELAAVMLDKVLFGLAVNSFHGAYGSSKGRGDTDGVLSARLEPTAGIARLMWGLAGYNEHLLGSVSLAGCRRYELPDVIRQIALAPADVIWSQERHVRPAETAGDGAARPGAAWDWEVNKVTYKTRDFMLSCAQDYRPGQSGAREHIWQATLGPDAVVFANHPLRLGTAESSQPGLWVGNGVLPRATQWGDVLVALYQLPADDWLGFTHAYFPAAAFDETLVTPQWAFARQGQGYLALMAAGGLEPITTGPTAHRELRSRGLENIWLCHMGQALLDGSFEEFQRKILAMEVSAQGLTLRVKTLRGDTLVFGWEGPLTVNDQEQPQVSARHIENPYCIAELPANQLEITYQDSGVRLAFD